MDRTGDFVGRAAELARLGSARADGTAMVLVTGDAGIGKSRLIGEHLAATTAVVVAGTCLPLATKLPLQAIADGLRGLERRGLLEPALTRTSPYVRAELGRLLPHLDVQPAPAEDPQRLFGALADVLASLEEEVLLVVEDVQLADELTLDCLTYLAQTGDGLVVLVSARDDGSITDWLAGRRRAPRTAEIGLEPLSLDETGRQIASLLGAEPPAGLVDELYERAEGNPFYTEEIVAAGSGRLPRPLVELLSERTRRLGPDAGAVLAALAIAGRPLDAELLTVLTGLPERRLWAAQRELSAARLVDEVAGGRLRPHHALLAEAVQAALPPGERAALHAEAATALAATGDPAAAAEIAEHWAGAGRPAEELPARIAAAEVAESRFGFADAALHWQRAIELDEQPDFYLRAIDAHRAAHGDGPATAALAEAAYARYGADADPLVAARANQYVSRTRRTHPETARGPAERALELYAGLPPSAEYADAMRQYYIILRRDDPEQVGAGLRRALEIAEAAGSSAMAGMILGALSSHYLRMGDVERGLEALRRGDDLADRAGDLATRIWLASYRCGTLLETGQLEEAHAVAIEALDAARRGGRDGGEAAGYVASTAAEALLARGRTSAAADLVDPLTTGPPRRSRYALHMIRARVDLARGEIAAAEHRCELLRQLPFGDFHAAIWLVWQASAEAALYAGRAGAALDLAREGLERIAGTDQEIFRGGLLVLGMRACGDLAEVARARADEAGRRRALAGTEALDRWADGAFADHPLLVTAAANGASYEAERSRTERHGDPHLWETAAKAWTALGRPHDAAYAWWRYVDAAVAGSRRPDNLGPVLRRAITAADEHVPLTAELRALARRARIELDPAEPPAAPSYRLTDRELAVLALLAEGRTNAEIGTELYMSVKTASVHVTNIMRKLGARNRVQAATLAQRAGLLPG